MVMGKDHENSHQDHTRRRLRPGLDRLDRADGVRADSSPSTRPRRRPGRRSSPPSPSASGRRSVGGFAAPSRSPSRGRRRPGGPASPPVEKSRPSNHHDAPPPWPRSIRHRTRVRPAARSRRPAHSSASGRGAAPAPSCGVVPERDGPSPLGAALPLMAVTWR